MDTATTAPVLPQAAAGGCSLAAGPHAAYLGEPRVSSSAGSGMPCHSLSKVLFAWGNAVSPHLAVEREGGGGHMGDGHEI